MKYSPLTLIAVMFLASSASIYGQETLTQDTPKKPAVLIITAPHRSFSVGFTGAYGLMLNSVSEFVLPTIPTCCPGYSNTSGGGFIGGAEIDLPIEAGLDFVGRLVYQSSGSTFSASEPTTVRVGNQAVATSFLHSMQTSTSFIMLEPMLDYTVTGGLSLFAGVRLGTTLAATYEQKETFSDPSIPFDYSDGTSVRNNSSGDIPNRSGFQMGMVFGTRYRLPLNAAGSVSLVPEVSFSPMFTDVVTDASWTISPIRIGLSVLFDVMSEERVASPLMP